MQLKMLSVLHWILFTLLLDLLLPAVNGIIIGTDSGWSPAESYDFVVIGGGTAGNVIANRLTEDPNIRVLVLEAGGSNEGILDAIVPLLCQRLFSENPYNWNFTTSPQRGLGGRVVEYPRGFILGGSSSINCLVYTRGSSDDWDSYAKLTNDSGWSWERIQPYIRKNERWTPPADHHLTINQFDPSVHGFSGVTAVSLPGFPRPIDGRILQTTMELSHEFPFNIDSNSGKQLGIGWIQSTIDGGKRSSSATSYLGPKYIGRENLHVMLHTQVTRILPQSNTSTVNETIKFNKVEFVRNNSRSRMVVTVKKEIIISAGVVGTPHILMHSGIGDQTVLSALGIQPLHHLPDVGQNMSDHANTGTIWSVNSTDTFEEISRNTTLLNEYLEQWKQMQTGYLVTTSANHWGWLRLPDNASIFRTFPDPAPGPNTAHFELYFPNGGFLFEAPPPGNFMGIDMAVLTPFSRGSITINSSDPFAHPIIDPALLTSDFDIYVLRHAIRSAYRFANASAWNGYILGPAGDLADIDISDDAKLDQYIRSSGGPGLHAVGTSAMSPKGASYGVTDPDLRVKGIRGVRIVDVSVLPFVPSAHTQAPTYIVAERAADLIKNMWNLST